MGFRGNDRKGTGFTNINRVLEANKGNRLGSTVASGAQQQATNVKNQISGSQAKFQQDAEKNRLDSEANKQKRDDVIGRFNETPDMQNFQASSGLQDKYNTGKNKLTTDLEAKKAQQINRPENFDQATYDKLQEYSRMFGGASLGGTTYAPTPQELESIRSTLQKTGIYDEGGVNAKIYRNNNNGRELDPSIANNLLSVAEEMKYFYNKAAPQREAEFKRLSQEKIDDQAYLEKRLLDTEREYQDALNAEKNTFMSQQAVDPTEQELADFNKFRTGGYTGPKSLQDFQTLMGNATEAQNIGDLTRSAGGRQEILRRFVGGDDYSQGQQRLDELLLGKSSGLNEARKATRGLTNQATQANLGAGATAKELENRAKIFNEETVNKLTEKKNPFNTQIDQRLAEIQANENKRGETLSNFENILQGKTDDTRKLDMQSRLDMGLKNITDAGYLPQNVSTQLNSINGLLERARNLGIDTTEQLSGRVRNLQGRNITRGGAANAFQEKQLNSLERLLGIQTPEFSTGTDDYRAGELDFDTAGLAEYIKSLESRK